MKFNVLNLLKRVCQFCLDQKRDLLYIFFISLVITFCDLWTKCFVFSEINDNGIYICSILNLLKVRNYGISFGLFSEARYNELFVYFIILLEILIILYLIYSISDKHKYKKPMLFITSVAFIIGGAIGNLIDRFYNKSVRDFIDLHIFDYHWPCFNVADIFVCIGVFLWILCEFFFRFKINLQKQK